MQHDDRHWNILLPWVLATMVGLALGILTVLTIVSRLALAGTPVVLVGLVGGAGIGVGIGIAQWFVLRRQLSGVGSWALLSVVGGTVGGALGLVVADALLPLLGGVLVDALQSRPTVPTVPWGSVIAAGICGAVVGVALGSAQWSVLRQRVRSGGWWVVGSGLAWMTGLGLSAALSGVVGVLASLLIAGIVIGGVTGLLLVYVLSDGATPAGQGIAPDLQQ